MTVTIQLPSETEAMVEARARAAGQGIEEYLRQLIAKAVLAPGTLAQAAEPFAQAVAAAGVSDEELASILSEARDAARKSRRETP